jgi:hypothetical protein
LFIRFFVFFSIFRGSADSPAAGRPCHTETATLREAVARNTLKNNPAFIYWGVVYPQQPWEEQGKG